MADRPVSLNIPDVIEGQSAMHWIALIRARNPLLSALYDYAYAVGARRTSQTIDAKESNLVAALEALPTYAPATPVAPKSVEEMADAIGAECTAPTKPPREMPAPEWTGPDRWQVWHGARASQPDNNPDKYGEPPDGFTPIGPWKFVAVYETSDCGPASVWERPLRRVQV